MRYLIIEDEPLAQEELVRMLKALDPNFILLASIDSVKQSIEWFNTNEQPDIVFMDIHLSDNICFEIFNKVEITVPVIFTVASASLSSKALAPIVSTEPVTLNEVI